MVMHNLKMRMHINTLILQSGDLLLLLLLLLLLPLLPRSLSN
jgi:hypothetical protein